MCRLFAALSTEDLFAPWFLLNAPQSLLMQSHADAKRLQGDGWGVGWFEGGRPQLRKSPGALYQQKRLLIDVSRRAKGKMLLGHVRWASNPMKLPQADVIGLVHTQPFVHQQWIFAHNGTLYIPREVRRELGAWEQWIQGNNDSEVLFYWLLKYLEKTLKNKKASGKKIAEGIRQSLQGLDAIWKSCRKQYPLYAYPYHGLNCLLTNGEYLIAFCMSDPSGFGKSKALCQKKMPYYQLQRLETKSMIAIASEPLDPKQAWKPFAHGEMLFISRQGGQLKKESWPLL